MGNRRRVCVGVRRRHARTRGNSIRYRAKRGRRRKRQRVYFLTQRELPDRAAPIRQDSYNAAFGAYPPQRRRQNIRRIGV